MMHDSNEATQYVPLRGLALAEPPLDAEVVPLLPTLSAELRKIYEDEAGLFQEEAIAKAVLQRQNRCFSRVLGEAGEYARYFERREVWNLWDLRPLDEAKGRCSIAAVPKRDSDDQRKILQVCPMNDAMLDVASAIGRDPGYGLQGPGAVAQVQAENDELHLASLDQSNAFTYIEVPPWWRRYQCAPTIAARELPPELL